MQDNRFSPEIRNKSIGGSDAASVLGLNKYKSAIDLWLEKTGQKEPDDLSENEYVYWGTVLEDVVAKEFEYRTGKNVVVNENILYHPEYKFLSANLDREVVGEDAILECKTANSFIKKEWDGEEIPTTYLIQVQHYLLITGKSKGYIAVLIGGNTFVWKEILRDNELIETMLEKYKKFWQCVETNTMPSLEEFAMDKKTIDYLYPESNGLSIDITSMESDIQSLLNLKERKKKIESEINVYESNIKNYLEDNEVGISENYKVTWKNQTTNRFDSKKFKLDYPEQYSRYLSESNSRVLRLKEL